MRSGHAGVGIVGTETAGGPLSVYVLGSFPAVFSEIAA